MLLIKKVNNRYLKIFNLNISKYNFDYYNNNIIFTINQIY